MLSWVLIRQLAAVTGGRGGDRDNGFLDAMMGDCHCGCRVARVSERYLRVELTGSASPTLQVETKQFVPDHVTMRDQPVFHI